MLQMRNIIPRAWYIYDHIFYFSNDGTNDRLVFEDDVDSFQQVYLAQKEGKSNQMININMFFPIFFFYNFIREIANQSVQRCLVHSNVLIF